MNDNKRNFYVKFKVDRKLGQPIMEAMLLSEDLDAVNQWNGHSVSQAAARNDKIKESKSIFQTVARDFEHSINVFQNSVPFIMSTLPSFGRIIDDKVLRGFATKHGECLEFGELELYKLIVDNISAFTKLFERSIAVKAGIRSIPRLFELGLISAYDAFLSQLIKAILITKPDILSSSERNISFKELVAIGSVEAARDAVIEKEVESVIRLSHAEQIEWLEKKLKMPLTKELKIWPDFIELCERRNLFTHTDGVVSSQYLKVCAEHGYNAKVSLGERLSVDNAYYSKAVSTILEIGFKLTQVVWRKLLPNEMVVAATELNEFAYRLLIKRKYKAATAMLEFGLYEMKKQGSDAVKKRMVINYANALKLAGNKAKASKILDGEDWSACTDEYRICIAAVRDDVESVIRMMKSVVDAKLMDISSIREWPVFEKIRADTKFIEAFEQTFGEKLLANRETTTPSKSDDSASSEHDAIASESDATDIEDKTVH